MTQQGPLAGPARGSRLRVVLVDDHEVIAAAVREALWHAPELVLVAAAPTVEALLTKETARWTSWSWTCASATGPARSGTCAFSGSRLSGRGVHQRGGPVLATRCRPHPVLGILRRSEPLPTITAALIRAAHESPVMTPDWAAAVQNDPLVADARLTAQEQRILARFADGNSATAIATEVGIALSTVEDYVRRIRAKYARVGRAAATKVDLYKRAVEDGFLPGTNKP